jgi:hypothetical protein
MERVLALCHARSFEPGRISSKVFAFEDAIDAWQAEDLRTVAAERT